MTQSHQHELSHGEKPDPVELFYEFESDRRCRLTVGHLCLVLQPMGVNEVVAIDETQLTLKTDQTKPDTVEGVEADHKVQRATLQTTVLQIQNGRF